MRNETEQQATVTAAEKTTVEFMQANINQLRGKLEEKKARSNPAAHWEGMIEDCEIILQHLETQPQPTRQDIAEPRPFA